MILSTLVASRAVIAVARSGIRVEIFTRQPILVGTGRAPLRAEVGKGADLALSLYAATPSLARG